MSEPPPSQLLVSSKTSLLNLPREILDIIYYYSLCTSEPIVVVPAKTAKVLRCCTWDGDGITSNDNDNDKTCAFHSTAFPALLQCHNRRVASEAAMVFYKSNSFSFDDDLDSWNPLYMFLQMIGPTNRSYIRNLSVQARQLLLVIQYRDGVRSTAGDWLTRKVITVYDRNVGPDLNPRVREESAWMFDRKPGYRLVWYLEEAIKAYFNMIGKAGSPMTLTLALSRNYLPGVSLMPEPALKRHKTIDFSNMMEKLRSKYTAEPGEESRVQLLWKARCTVTDFEARKERIEERGWRIVDVEKKVEKNVIRQEDEDTAVFTLRRLYSTYEPSQYGYQG